MKTDLKKLSVGLLYDDTLDSSDGVAGQVKTLGGWLTSQGHRVFYMSGQTQISHYSGSRVYSLSKNLKVSFNGNRLTMPIYSSGARIRQILASEAPDVIHVQAPYSPIMAQRVLSRAYKKSALVGTFHIYPSGVLSSFGAKLLGYYQRRSLRRLDNMVSVSQPAASFARRGFGLDSIIIPNMIDIAAIKSAHHQPGSRKTIVFLGRLVERKGCRQLIEAFGLLCQTRLDVRLLIAGKGPQRQSLEALARKLQIAPKVSFVGYLAEDKKGPLLASADIACFPSTGGESFGVVLIEAMAAGAKVVLGGDNPGYRSVLAGQPKLLIDPNASSEFAARLEQLLSDEPLIDKIQLWQQRQINQYDVNLVGRKYLDIYKDAIAKHQTYEA